jgi:hypothetical protein
MRMSAATDLCATTRPDVILGLVPESCVYLYTLRLVSGD